MVTDLRHEGWCSDPFGSHDARWLSNGMCTELVRDQGIESYDAVPVGAPPYDAVPIAWGLAAPDGIDLLRSDRSRPSHREAMAMAASAILARTHD